MAIEIWKTKAGAVRFRVKIKDSAGKWYPSISFEHKEDARSQEADYMGRRARGEAVMSGDAEAVTVDQYWEVWSRENRGEVSGGWKISQNQMFRDYISPVLGRTKMGKIGVAHVGRVMNVAQEAGRSPQTRKHIYSLMRKMFGDAVEYYEMLGESPVKARHHRPNVPKTKRAFLPPTVATTLLIAARDHYIGPAVWLQLLAALRAEAMIGLDWSSVKWDLNQILICRAWKSKIRRLEAFPKGKDWEWVPMVPALKEYLFGVWDARGRPTEGFVCNSVNGGMLPYDSYEDALRRLCAIAEVPRVTSHGLRHSATEMWVDAGASLEDLRRLLGHKNASTTNDYVHRTDERLSRIARSVGKPALMLVNSQKSSQAGNKKTYVESLLSS